MKGSIFFRNFFRKNKFLVSFVLVLLVVSASSLAYAYSLNLNTLDGIEKVKYSSDEEVQAIDSVLDGIASSATEETMDIVAVTPPPIVVADASDSEDPQKVVSQVKGSSKKQEDISNALKKYETNETSLGIDVSTYQGDIDWAQVKEAGVKFAMIRCGFRRLESGAIVMDNKFERNIKGALANNINVGIYFFSMAKTEEEAYEEAAWVLEVIKDYDITYPIATDVEIFNQYRLAGVSYSQMTTNALAFCAYIRKNGYTPMIYSYANALTKYFETGRFGENRVWLAQYNDVVTYKGKYYMWQYTSNGYVPGINGRVDMDIAYFSVTSDASATTPATGNDGTPDLENVYFKDCDLDGTLKKDVILRNSPYLNLPNKTGTLGAGTEIKVIGIGKEFIKIKDEDNIFYIDDLDCFDYTLENVSFTETDLDAKLTKKVTLLSSPYTFLDNEVRNLNENMKIHIIGLNANFLKIALDDTYYYIADVDCYTVIKDNTVNANAS